MRWTRSLPASSEELPLTAESERFTVIGAVLLGIINQGMSIMGVSANYQSVVKGLVLLIAVLFDVVSKKKE